MPSGSETVIFLVLTQLCHRVQDTREDGGHHYLCAHPQGMCTDAAHLSALWKAQPCHRDGERWQSDFQTWCWLCRRNRPEQKAEQITAVTFYSPAVCSLAVHSVVARLTDTRAKQVDLAFCKTRISLQLL